MTDEYKEKIVRAVALHSLECIKNVAEDAINQSKSARSENLTFGNTFNHPSPQISLNNNQNLINQYLETQLKQPVVARISYIDEDGNKDTIFITRYASKIVQGFTLASYNSRWGRIASLVAGDKETICPPGGHERHQLCYHKS